MADREASDLFKALRLQKLRALEIILDSIIEDEEKDIAVAVEIYEDVYARTTEGELFEQDKNYSPGSKFTFNSDEILKSLSSFIDIFIKNQYSENILFCFLSTNQIGKEGPSKRSKELNIYFPSEPLLLILQTENIKKIEEVIGTLKALLLDYYKRNGEEENNDIITSWSDITWTSFFKQIKWVFNNPSIEEIEKSIESKIRDCPYFSSLFNEDTVRTIKSGLIDLIDKKATSQDRFFRLIQKSDVNLQFRPLVSRPSDLNEDEVYKLWKEIDQPTDVRNLSDKILDVCPDYDPKKIKRLERKAAMAKVEESKLSNSRKYLSLKYRVFDYCDNKLYLKIQGKEKFTESEIENIISDIEESCRKEFSDWKGDYDYGITRESIILELFIEFLDSCYLAFDS